ncbi:MAG TPA: hypothetical protein VGB22_05995 [candidate division Zixibacteria bacterium]|jgi:hypothetical protein
MTAILMAVLFAVFGCRSAPTDPIEEVKAMIPKIESALNRRLIGDLQRMGTGEFEANSFIMDMVGQRVDAQATLSLRRAQLTGNEIHMALDAKMVDNAGTWTQRLFLTMLQDGRWKIAAYEIGTPDDELPPLDGGIDSL